MSLAVKRYAEALINTAEEGNCLEEVYEEFTTLYTTLREDPFFPILLERDILTVSEKQDLINSVFGEGNSYFRSFLLLLAERKHLDEVEDMYLSFRELYREKERILAAEVVTAAALTEELREKLVTALRRKYNVRLVELTETVDPEILGGMTIYANNEMLDASLKTRFEGLREHLKQTEIK